MVPAPKGRVLEGEGRANARDRTRTQRVRASVGDDGGSSFSECAAGGPTNAGRAGRHHRARQDALRIRSSRVARFGCRTDGQSKELGRAALPRQKGKRKVARRLWEIERKWQPVRNRL